MKKIICFLTIVLLLSFSGCSDNNSSSSMSDINKIYKDSLDFGQYKTYLNWYGFVDNGTLAFMERDDSYTFEINKKTEFVVKNINEYFFGNSYNPEAARSYLPMLKEYGVTEETPLTTEWVYNNPYKAYHILHSIDPSTVQVLCHYPPDWGYPLPDDSSIQDSSSNV